MKYLTLGIAAVLSLGATQVQAQYDAIANATTANYYTGPGFNLAGDVIQATGTFDSIDVIYVALAPGNYPITVNGYNSYTFSNQINPIGSVPFVTASGTINVPNTGTFPQVVGVTATIPGGVALAGTEQAFTFSSTTDFYVAVDNSAAVPAASDPYNGFSYDTNQSGVLEPGPPVNEWYTFDPAWTNSNVLFALYTAPPARGDMLGSGQISARILDGVPVNHVKRPLSVRINPNL